MLRNISTVKKNIELYMVFSIFVDKKMASIRCHFLLINALNNIIIVQKAFHKVLKIGVIRKLSTIGID